MLRKFLDYMKQDSDFMENVKYDENGRLILNNNLVRELMRAIKEGKITLIMDEQDLNISVGNELPNSTGYKGKLFEKLSDIVAVHITPIPPNNDTIMTQENSGVMQEMIFVNPVTQTRHSVPYLTGNDTVHFTLNCVVHNHESGNDWNSYKYGIMVDFDKMNKSKILDVKSEDTYVDGNAELNCSYFLFCPLGEKEKVVKNNPNAIVIEYDGISLTSAISMMIVLTGRKLEPYGTYGWGRNQEYSLEVDDVYKLEKLVSNEGYPVLKGQFGNALHSETKYMTRRMWKREYEALISLIKYNQDNNIEMPDNLIQLIMLYGGAYSMPGTVPVSFELFKEIVFPILEKYDYYVDESLFDGVEEDNNMKLIYYLQNGEKFPVIECPSWENEIRNRIIKILKNNVKGNVK